MTIKLIAVGKTDQKELQSLIHVYESRLKHYISFEIIITPDLKNTKSLSETLQKEREGQLIIKNLIPTDILILLDEKGQTFNSLAFSDYLQKHMLSGCKQLVFVIGGPYGFSEAVYAQAKGKISLSKMTFSHQIIRLFMVEQLYRGFSILKNEPYHHQ
jgi:23S rRNA (pseudouridine1915-N3)-methyltransferase